MADGLRDCLSRLAVVHPEALYSLVHAFDFPRPDWQRSGSLRAGRARLRPQRDVAYECIWPFLSTEAI